MRLIKLYASNQWLAGSESMFNEIARDRQSGLRCEVTNGCHDCGCVNGNKPQKKQTTCSQPGSTVKYSLNGGTYTNLYENMKLKFMLYEYTVWPMDEIKKVRYYIVDGAYKLDISIYNNDQLVGLGTTSIKHDSFIRINNTHKYQTSYTSKLANAVEMETSVTNMDEVYEYIANVISNQDQDSLVKPSTYEQRSQQLSLSIPIINPFNPTSKFIPTNGIINSEVFSASMLFTSSSKFSKTGTFNQSVGFTQSNLFILNTAASTSTSVIVLSITIPIVLILLMIVSVIAYKKYVSHAYDESSIHSAESMITNNLDLEDDTFEV
jgi:hypothetical protein